ncbi:MAG: hypothetical protein HYU28_05215 [Actinobacteria bacterium]|nr:hypothetical protein [Actinomycetota bacterium]
MQTLVLVLGIQYGVYFAVSLVRARRRGQRVGTATQRILARSLAPCLRYAAVTALTLAFATLIWANAWAGLFSASMIEALREDGGGTALIAGLLAGGFTVYLVGWRLRFVRTLAPARVLAARTPTIAQGGGWRLPSFRALGWGLALGAFEAAQLSSSWDGLLEQPRFWGPAAVCAVVGFFLLIVTTKRDVAALNALTRPLAWIPPAPPVAEAPPKPRRVARPRAAPRTAGSNGRRQVHRRDSNAPRRERPLRAAGR